jgi:hypothetical protein
MATTDYRKGAASTRQTVPEDECSLADAELAEDHIIDFVDIHPAR